MTDAGKTRTTKEEEPIPESSSEVLSQIRPPARSIEQMAASTPEIVVAGEIPTEEEVFYVEWGFETIKNNLKFLNEVLRQLVTLSATLLGGSIAFLDATLIGAKVKNAAVAVFFLALIVSFLGILPHRGEIDPQNANSVKRHKDTVYKWKSFYLLLTEIFLALGFLITVIGMITH
jgi:hypothetical protein